MFNTCTCTCALAVTEWKEYQEDGQVARLT